MAAVIADMTATTFCDTTGARELLLAHHKATADANELQIVMPPSANIRRLCELTGLDQVLAIYPSLAAVSTDGHMEPAGREAEPADQTPVPCGPRLAAVGGATPCFPPRQLHLHRR